MILIFLAATWVTIARLGIAEVGRVTMVIVLKAVNIPITGIWPIVIGDWFLDRYRTR